MEITHPAAPPRYTNITSTMSAELLWTITQFGSVELGSNKKKKIESPKFHSLGDDSRKWTVILHLDGDKNEQARLMVDAWKISFFLHTESPLQPECMQATITYSISDGKSVEKIWAEIITRKFPAESVSSWAFPYLPREQRRSIENLLFRCKLEYQVTKSVPISDAVYSDLASDLMRFVTSSMKNKDVIFVVGEREIPAHKFILSIRSPVFAAMFQQDEKEAALNRFKIADIEPDIFEALIRYINSDQVDLTSMEMCKALLAATTRFFVDLLKSKCETFLIQNLTIQNCSELLMLAHALCAINLKKSAVNVIRDSPAEVIKTSGWKELKKSNLELACETLEHLLLLK